MDTIYYLIQKMLPVAIPLLLVALGGMFSERSGIINIALEGIMLFGAYFGVLFIYFTQASSMNPQIIFLIGMIVAMISGLVYSLLLAFGSINMKANQVIVGTAMNMFIPAVVLLFSKMFFSSDGITTNIILYINEVPILSQIPILGDILFKNTEMKYIADSLKSVGNTNHNYIDVDSDYGHDAFLVELDKFEDYIKEALDE